MKKSLLLLLFLVMAFFAGAQVQKTFHQTYDVSGAEIIQLSLADGFEVQTWAGNNVMIEMTIKLSHVQQNVLDYIIHQEGRYVIKMDRPQDNIVQLVSKNPSRKTISVKGVDCEETVIVRVFVPDNYHIEDSNMFRLIQPGTNGSHR